MTNVIFAALLFVLGIGALGGAIFGRLRTRRLILLALTVILWLAAAIVYAGRLPVDVSDLGVDPTATPTIIPTATPEPEPTATLEPTATPTTAPAALFGRLVFASQRSGDFEIWDLDLATGEDSQLTRSTANDVEPVYSHDGSRIVFSSGRDIDGGVNELWLMNADGSDQRKLVEWPESYEWGAAWSPDDEWIVFTTTKDFNYELYIVPADGSAEPLNLSQAESLETYPDWSPDGRWLAFVSDRGGNWDIWKMDVEACLAARLAAEEDATACEATQLTDNEDDDFFPRWSPDGKNIAFESRRETNRDIYIMDADGGNVTRVTDNVARESTPIWANDGEALIFSSERNYDWNLYIILLSTGEERQLTSFEGEDRFGDWKP